MQSAILSLAIAANLVSAAGLRPRDPVSDAAAFTSAADAFTSAADALISSYIPANEWESLTSAVGAAASSAGVTADVKSVVYSALKATEAPEWFVQAIPTAYASQYAALESVIDDLRPTVLPPVATVVPVTTTDADGNTITTSISATITPVPTTITTDVVPTPSVSVVTGTDSAGSTFTSTIVGSNATATDSAASTTTETVTDSTATGSATATESESGSDATGTGATGSSATGTDAPSSTNAAAPTAMAHGLAGVAAVFGLVMAL